MPNKPGEALHVDIFLTDSKHYLACIDTFPNLQKFNPSHLGQLSISRNPLYEL